MSTITVNVVHTIDPASIEALRGLLAPKTTVLTVGELQPGPSALMAATQQTSSAPAATAPVTPAPQPVAIPTQQAPTPVASAANMVPTTDRTYTIDELARAGAALMDAGKGADALAAMQQFGIQRVTDLLPEQYAAFAAALRGLGAKI